MHNPEKDEREMTARRELLLETGFRLFSERSIDAVSLQQVADAGGIGIATVYRYFRTKSQLVLAIAARKWEEYYDEVESAYARAGGDAMNAAEELDFYLSAYIALYCEHRDVLRFNQDFNGYVLHAGLTDEQLRAYREAASVFARKFHRLYEKGRKDGTIRTDVPEERMFVSTMHIMLAVVGRFAQGVVIHDGAEDLTEELQLLKRSLLREFLTA